jgi:hypothetical protein
MKNNKRFILALLVGAFGFCFNAMAKELPFQSVRIFKVTTEIDNGKPVVLIRGVCMESALVVKKVDVSQNDGQASFVIEAGVNSEGDKSLTGGFSVKIPKTPELKQISYGKEHEVVWSSQTGT